MANNSSQKIYRELIILSMYIAIVFLVVLINYNNKSFIV